GGHVVAVLIGTKDEAAILLCGGLEKFVSGLGSQFGQGVGADAFGEFDADLLGFGERLELERAGIGGKEGAAFADGLLKQMTGEGRSHERADRAGTGGFAADGDVTGIATESGDVFDNPFESSNLIEKAVVARGMVTGLFGEFRVGEKAEDAEAIVWFDHD